jgi:hypothetical protein
MPVYGYYVFPKPSVRGFPTVDDPADRSCRYLAQPPTVPSMARLRGFQRPPRGGRGRCRRACERTPLRGRRRCAAGGRPGPSNKAVYVLFELCEFRAEWPVEVSDSIEGKCGDGHAGGEAKDCYLG